MGTHRRDILRTISSDSAISFCNMGVTLKYCSGRFCGYPAEYDTHPAIASLERSSRKNIQYVNECMRFWSACYGVSGATYFFGLSRQPRSALFTSRTINQDHPKKHQLDQIPAKANIKLNFCSLVGMSKC